MNNREARKKIAEDTLKIMEDGFFMSPSGKRIDISEWQEKAESNTKIYTPKESDELILQHFEKLSHPTEITVTRQTTLDATRQLFNEGHKDVLCLNFASARNPGGGFLGGSQAQEESIARSTGLYNCQLKAFDYYEINRKTKSCFYTDHMIYSPNVPIFKNEEGKNLEEFIHCGIITAPAINTGVVKRKEPKKIIDIEHVMERRIKKVLAISLENHHSTLVLGAWGCGVFQNEPTDIARIFREVLDMDFKNRFRKIVFAIYAKNDRFINPFLKEFNSHE